jgi:hypothetical protein
LLAGQQADAQHGDRHRGFEHRESRRACRHGAVR